MSGSDATVQRLRTNDLELGATEAVQKHFARHIVSPKPVSQRKLNFERARPRWLRECLAEATGVFFYVFPGIAATASFTLNEPATGSSFGSLFTVGWAFALGIAFAIITCAPTSGGHFNPAITLCFAVWQGFPWRKVPHYIFSQIIGAFVAGLLLMGMYHVQLGAFAETLRSQGHESMVFNGGPASVLCTFPKATQTNLGYLFLTEFFVASYIGIVIWAALDPANPFISPAGAPFAIGMAYAVMVWGFADITISTNMARDLGTRIVAAIFYGGEAFSYLNYSWISILVNVPATLFATGYYELVMRDSLQKIGKGAALHEGGEEALAIHLTRTGITLEREGTDTDDLEKGM